MGCFGTIRQTGAGGVGIAGSNLSIVNAGSIIGGTQNDGSMRVAAVALSGSGNRYEM